MSTSLSEYSKDTKISESAKAKYEEKIKNLESKLLKAQEGNIDHTSAMLELTQDN